MGIQKPKTATEMIRVLWDLVVGHDSDGMYYQVKEIHSRMPKAVSESVTKKERAKEARRKFMLDMFRLLIQALSAGGVVVLFQALTK